MLIIIGFLFMVLMFALVGVIADILPLIIDIPSLIMVLIPLVFFLCVSKSGCILVKYIRSSFKKNYKYSRLELEGISAAIKNIIKFIMAVGGFVCVVCLIASITHLETLELVVFAANLAVSTISLTYAFALSYLVFFPTMAWAENKLKTSI